jgi:NADPH-dependent 7-cyano-7-deazaguanine reductase QueF-like protein
MKDFIDYLINDSSYKFFINNFNMPKIEEEEAFNVAIPLVLFYVDIENKIKK